MDIIQFSLIPEIYVTRESIDLISNDNMYARIPEGTIWAPLNNETETIVAVLYGRMEYAADIIYDSELGARGKTFKDTVDGYKFYLGGTPLREKSSQATTYDLKAHNYSSEGDFFKDAEHHLENYGKQEFKNNYVKQHKQGEGKILWSPGDKEKNVLFADAENTGVVLGGHVHLIGPKGFVSVEDGTVIVQNDDGKDIVIDRDGIRSPKELRDLGENISATVRKAMKNINLKFRH